jgi:citrate lyase subunit beta / citryl-CoA lyase
MDEPWTEPCSMLFVPADSDRFLAKAGQRGADVLILDLEDAVARAAKPGARANLAGFVPRLQGSSGVPVLVRVNHEPNLLTEDLQAAVAAGADGLLMPKVDVPAQVERLDEHLRRLEAQHGRRPGRMRVVALMETPLAVCNAPEIARSSPRLCALLFGPEDFAAALGVSPDPANMVVPAQLVVMAAVAAGLQPMGLPGSVAEFTDTGAYREVALRGRHLGLRGAVCIHPAQVPIVNEVFGGTPEEAEQARGLLRAFDASVAAGRGAVAYEGRMVDEPVAARARRFLLRHESLQARRSGAGQRTP